MPYFYSNEDPEKTECVWLIQMNRTVSWSPSEHLPSVFLGGQIRFTLTVSPLCLMDIILYTVPKV